MSEQSKPTAQIRQEYEEWAEKERIRKAKQRRRPYLWRELGVTRKEWYAIKEGHPLWALKKEIILKNDEGYQRLKEK